MATVQTQTQTMSWIALLLRLEGLAVLIGAVAVYAAQYGDWLAFILLLFVPDLSMIGYMRGSSTGAALYNAAHTYLAPGMLAAIGLAAGAPLLLQIALIWVAHIGMDRALGYGLKYGAFKDTHLQRV